MLKTPDVHSTCSAFFNLTQFKAMEKQYYCQIVMKDRQWLVKKVAFIKQSEQFSSTCSAMIHK